MNKYKIILYVLFFSLELVKGQINTYSPYSYFAIGQLHPVGNNYNISMGGLGTSLMPTQYLNFINPASYSFLDKTAFEFGMRSSFINMSEDNVQQKNFVGGLTNLGLGFPISKKLSLSASLLPYSSVGYNLTKEEAIYNNLGDSIANSITTYNGSGGINKFLAGVSWNILSNLAIGVHVNYLFGSIDRETQVYSNQSAIYLTELTEKYIRGINFDFGLLYSKYLENYKVNFGLTIKPGKDINTESNIVQAISTSSTHNPLAPDYDVIDTNLDEDNHTHFPLESSIGLSLQANDQWLLGIDYRYINWKNYQENSVKLQNMQNSNELILGGFFTPNKEDIYNYFNRVQYRLGLSYSTGHLLDYDNQRDPLTHFSGTFGMGLPINRVSSKANIAFKYGLIKSGLNSKPISEKYFSIYLSMTLNEKWFQKIKIQ